MDQNMTLEKRIAAELYSYQGRMSAVSYTHLDVYKRQVSFTLFIRICVK